MIQVCMSQVQTVYHQELLLYTFCSVTVSPSQACMWVSAQTLLSGIVSIAHPHLEVWQVWVHVDTWLWCLSELARIHLHASMHLNKHGRMQCEPHICASPTAHYVQAHQPTAGFGGVCSASVSDYCLHVHATPHCCF